MNITSGADIIAVIILIALAIAIIVYLLHWLYRRSSKEIAFVRTGMGGEQVVISGGAFVLPIISREYFSSNFHSWITTNRALKSQQFLR